MISYHGEIRSENYVYSIDKLVIKGSFNPKVDIESPWPNEFMKVDFLEAFRRLCYQHDKDCTAQHHDSFSFLTYKDMWNIQFPNGSIAKFFFRLNGYTGSDDHLYKIEYNPNKVPDNRCFFDLLHFVLHNSACPYVSSFDLAVDIPIPREDFFLIKDNRKYQLIMNSASDKTEYLGCRQENGFVKLYNKRLESHLDYDLTRLEITFTAESRDALISFGDVYKRIPEVYYFDSLQLTTDEMAYNGTDRVLLEYALVNPQSLMMLPQVKKTKIKGYLQKHVRRVSLDKNIVFKLYADVMEVL